MHGVTIKIKKKIHDGFHNIFQINLILNLRISYYHLLPYSFKIRFNIILPSTPISSKSSPSFRFPHQNHVPISSLLHACHMPCPINLLTPNVNYSGRTAPLTSKVAFYIFIQQIYVLNILNMVYTLRFFSLQNAVCFIIITCLVPVLFTFYIQGVLK